MFEKQIDIGALIAISVKEELNLEDKKMLEEWLSEHPANSVLFDELMQAELVHQKMIKFNAADRNTVWNKVVKKVGKISESVIETKKVSLWPRISIVAATALVIMGLALLFYNQFSTDKHNVVYSKDIAPGKVGATLTLANGKKIILSEVGNGELAKQGEIRIIKKYNGQIVYNTGNYKGGLPNEINTLSTGRGQTYILTLPDQSKVWMNAASSLTYVAALTQNGIRRVKLEGEAYFEISKDKQHPFVVESNGQEVEVLGTHFNISSYKEDSATKTTLLEGSVRVTSLYSKDVNLGQLGTEFLKPNQQAIHTSEGIKVKNVDAGSFVDWKNGVFNFEDENLQAIMRKIARWYDVDVIYEGTENDTQTFSGTISRSANVSKVLETFGNSSKLKFKIDGKKIFVTK